MNKIKRSLFLFLPAILGLFLHSCVDDEITPEPPEPEESWVDPNLPDEIRNGFSVSFNIALSDFGSVNGTRADMSNIDLLGVDNFIDLERVRILFFVCAEDDNNKSATTSVADTAHSVGRFGRGDLPYLKGNNDHFLFESKSRWVSQLEVDESTSALYQVTAPVFTYGNNDEYRWEDIRWALQHYPFKVVILANRPDKVNFGDFDTKFGGNVEFDSGRGPYWGPEDTWIPRERRGLNPDFKAADEETDWSKKPIIHDLHHCQWDMVYASKNSGDKGGTAGLGVYNFIMKNPKPRSLINNQYVPQPGVDDGKVNYDISQSNMMGALSAWTENGYYILPDKTKHPIPMYGVQIFDKIENWSTGSPFNLSDGHYNTSGQYIRKNINLLRSLVKLELRVPKTMKYGGKDAEVRIVKASLNYSNVMARCEPLDVATPPERLWHEENWDADFYCEWKNLYDRGPIIHEETNTNNGAPAFIQERYAWFYGAWKDWWHFNFEQTDENGAPIDFGLNPESENFNYHPQQKAEFPRIYNPVIQRNSAPDIEKCKVDRPEDAYHYYVVYTGERNINDPSKFGTAEAFNAKTSEFAYWCIEIRPYDENGQALATSFTYKIPLTDYNKNDLVRTSGFYKENNTDAANYRVIHATAEQDDWNWPLLRNHVYTFTVRNIGSYSETGDWFSVESVSSEKRRAPGFWFN